MLNQWDWLKWSRELCGLKPLSSWVLRPNRFLNFISMLVFQMYFADFPWGLRWQCDKQLSKDFSPLSLMILQIFITVHSSCLASLAWFLKVHSSQVSHFAISKIIRTSNIHYSLLKLEKTHFSPIILTRFRLQTVQLFAEWILMIHIYWILPVRTHEFNVLTETELLVTISSVIKDFTWYTEKTI